MIRTQIAAICSGDQQRWMIDVKQFPWTSLSGELSFHISRGCLQSSNSPLQGAIRTDEVTEGI